jgi:hypothetical protein
VTLSGRHCVVVGSAPLVERVTIQATDYVVAVNGGISSCPIADAWVVNARSQHDAATAGAKAWLHRAMLEQGRGRRVGLLLLMSKGDGAELNTCRRLEQLGVQPSRQRAIDNEERRALETQAGARDSSMQRHALSLGMFAACWCFLQGAETVRLVGFSWTGGYAYLPDEPILMRGHEAGDKQALVRLSKKYGERLIHSLTKEKTMATAKTTSRPNGLRQAAASVRQKIARAAVTPAAERARKVQRQKDAKASGPKRGGARMVRATALTFYGNKRRKAGEVFALRDDSHFRESCMEDVAPGTEPTPAPLPDAAPEPGGTVNLQPNAADPIEGDPATGTDDNPLGV